MNCKMSRLQGLLMLWVMTASALTAPVGYAQTRAQLEIEEDRLRTAVQEYLQKPPLQNFEPTPYLFAFVNLADAEKRQAVVYLTDQGWCGSSGCTLLILSKDGDSYKTLSRIPGVRLPISRLATSSHGWRDLSVLIQGGGVMDGYRQTLRFNGAEYSEVLSDRQKKLRTVRGTVILSWKTREVPLYP